MSIDFLKPEIEKLRDISFQKGLLQAAMICKRLQLANETSVTRETYDEGCGHCYEEIMKEVGDE